MPSTGLGSGPHELSHESVDRRVVAGTIGVYVLERSADPSAFTVNYVGRSDEDLNARLKNWVGKNGYRRFKFDYLSSRKSAFEKECEIYHLFNGLDNEIHPQRPIGGDWQCPYCNNFRYS